MEGKLAMDMARSEAQVVDNQMGLEETRKHLVKEALQLDQAARAKEVKSKQTAKIEAVAKEKAEKELKANNARQAEMARRAEADRKAEADSLSWRETSPQGVTPRKKAPYHWPRAVGMRLVSRDEIPANSNGYR